MSLKIMHDLSQLSAEQLEQYKRDVSAFVGLDPDLNGLDTIWMENEHGPGKSLVLYARRGTAEILRELNGIEVSSLTSTEIQGSIVFTAVGKNKLGRQEIATGSKDISKVNGRALDNAIMTASTRALRRLTMQFTKLGILDESEIEAVSGSTVNPASGATLAGSPMVIPPAPQVAPNSAPGRDVTPTAAPNAAPVAPAMVTLTRPMAPATLQEKAALVNQAENLAQVYAEGAAALAARPTPPDIKAAKTSAISETPTPVSPVVAPVTQENEAAKKADIPADKPKRARKKANTVSMDGPEAEVVSNSLAVPPVATVAPPATVVPEPVQPERIQTIPVPPQVNSAVSTQAIPAALPQANSAAPVSGTSVPNQGTDFPGKPTDVQMTDYRKRVGVYTVELQSSENMGSVQKMRAFITRMSDGTAPQFMTVDQWEEILSWFEAFVAKNQVKGLVKYINDSLGVK